MEKLSYPLPWRKAASELMTMYINQNHLNHDLSEAKLQSLMAIVGVIDEFGNGRKQLMQKLSSVYQQSNEQDNAKLLIELTQTSS